MVTENTSLTGNVIQVSYIFDIPGKLNDMATLDEGIVWQVIILYPDPFPIFIGNGSRYVFLGCMVMAKNIPKSIT